MVCLSAVCGCRLEKGVPHLVVSGDWLLAFGFEVGTKVIIEASLGQIVIKPLFGEGVEV